MKSGVRPGVSALQLVVSNSPKTQWKVALRPQAAEMDCLLLLPTDAYGRKRTEEARPVTETRTLSTPKPQRPGQFSHDLLPSAVCCLG
jgi:hypothetical protein